jgi:hypothetical protein
MKYLEFLLVVCGAVLLLSPAHAATNQKSHKRLPASLELEFRNRIPEVVRFEKVPSESGYDHLVTYILDGKMIAREPVPEKTFNSLVNGLNSLRDAGRLSPGQPCAQAIVLKTSDAETICLDRVSLDQKGVFTGWLNRVQVLLALKK